MDLDELQNVILPGLKNAIRFSLLNDLNIHTPIGGKFAELYVASKLWKYEPKLGQQRGRVEYRSGVGVFQLENSLKTKSLTIAF